MVFAKLKVFVTINDISWDAEFATLPTLPILTTKNARFDIPGVLCRYTAHAQI
jgi:hypothetical protein